MLFLKMYLKYFCEFKYLNITLEITLYSGFPNYLIGCFIITNNAPVSNTGVLNNTQPLNNGNDSSV